MRPRFPAFPWGRACPAATGLAAGKPAGFRDFDRRGPVSQPGKPCPTVRRPFPGGFLPMPESVGDPSPMDGDVNPENELLLPDG